MLDRVEWYIPGRVLFASLSGRITMIDITEMWRQMDDLIEREALPDVLLHYVLDLREKGEIGSDVLSLSSAGKLFRPRDKRSIQLAIDPKPMQVTAFLVSAVARTFGFHFQMVATPEEAWTVLRRADPSLPDVQSSVV